MTESVSERVVALIAEKAMLERDAIEESTTLEKLGIDSLALVEVVFAVEEEFGVEVPFNANDPGGSDFDISTVGSVVESVRRLLDRAP